MIAAALNHLLAIGARPTDSLELGQKKRIMVGALLVIILLTSISSATFWQQGAPRAGLTLALMNGGVAGVLLLLWVAPQRFVLCVHSSCLFNTLGSLMVTLLLGGLSGSGGSLMWGILSPLAALILLGARAMGLWLAIYGGTVMVGLAAPRWLPPSETLPSLDSTLGFNMIFLGPFVLGVLVYFVRQRDQAQRRSDQLLRAILPDEVVERLKAGEPRIADYFEDGSVLFADVESFTPLSATLPPTELVALLDEVFSEFDRLVGEAGVEKIKTIGDSYMVAAGVPTARADHALALARLALAMQARVAAGPFHGHRLRFRIGIHSGPLVAGVIGQQRFLYDLWGDTVNIASRMESHGEANLIQISAHTRARLGPTFHCQSRGTVQVKGKGEMELFALLSEVGAPLAGAAER